MLHFKMPETKGPLKVHLNPEQSRIYGHLDHFAEVEEVRTSKKSFKEHLNSLCRQIATFFQPLWDKAYEHLEPYIATYEKNRRDKKREKERHKGGKHRNTKKPSTKKNHTQGIDEDSVTLEYPDTDFENGTFSGKEPDISTSSKRNPSRKANVVSKDLINQVARMNAKDE